jgi:hypothetical protein
VILKAISQFERISEEQLTFSYFKKKNVRTCFNQNNVSIFFFLVKSKPAIHSDREIKRTDRKQMVESNSCMFVTNNSRHGTNKKKLGNFLENSSKLTLRRYLLKALKLLNKDTYLSISFNYSIP